MSALPEQMRVCVLRGAWDVVVEERPVPLPGPDEVLVQVASVGVCGSDTHYYEHGRIGRFVVEQPLVLGHEASGYVVAVGDNVERARVGQRVSLEPGVPDLVCEQCLAGRYNLCPAMRFFATPPVDGAFAEYVALHQAFAHPVPDRLSDDAAALLEPLSVAVWACSKGRVGAGSRVLVTGAGPIGLLVLQTALALGAGEVVVSDVSAGRLAVAAARGATATRDARSEPEDDFSPDVLVECSGATSAVTAGLAALRPAGRAVLVGMGGDVPVPLTASLVQERELEVTGTFRYANTWPTAIALATSGRVDLDALVTSRHPLEQAEEALTASRRDPAALKAVVSPSAA